MAVIGSADIVIRAITKDFDKDVKKALKSVNTGGGGARGSLAGSVYGTGGSGVVIIRYAYP